MPNLGCTWFVGYKDVYLNKGPFGLVPFCFKLDPEDNYWTKLGPFCIKLDPEDNYWIKLGPFCAEND